MPGTSGLVISTKTDSSRRAAVLAVIPLATIAIGFFVKPIVRASNGAEMTAPFEEPGMLALGYHPTALLLALVTVSYLARRRAPGLIAELVAYTGMLWCAASQVAIVATVFGEPAAGDYPFAIGAIATLAGSIAFVVLARQRRDWDRWLCLLGGYAFISLPYGCPRIMGMFNEWSGGLMFVVAELALLTIVATAVPRRQ
jgi:hypothetical protein